MSRYADPTRCPNCDAYANGSQRCANCGLLLLGPTPQLLLTTLGDADRILDGLRAEAYGWQRAQSVQAARPYPRPAERQPAAPPRRSSWSIGSTLLALGALCLVVAAFVFVSVSWGSFGLLGRTTLLAAATTAIGGVAVVVTRRRLRASAEALWSVFLAMIVLDYLGARAYGLLGMGAWPDDVAMLVLGALLAGASAGAGCYALGRVRMSLAVPEVGAGLGVTLAVTVLGATVQFGAFWAALSAVVVALAAAATLRGVGLRYAAWYSAGLSALAQLAAITLAVGEVFAYRDDAAFFVRDGVLHTIIASAVTYVLGAGGYAVARRRGSEDAGLIAGATTAVAVTPALALAYAPVNGSSVGTQAVAASVLVVLAGAGIVAHGTWSRGIRVTAAIAALPPLVVATSWLGTAAGSIIDTMTPVWSTDAWARVQPIDADLGPAWVAIVTFGSLAAAIAATGWYADVAAFMRMRIESRWVAASCAVAGVFVAACRLSPPVVVLALVVIGVGVLVCGLTRRIEQQLAGLGLLIPASVVTASSMVASIASWAVVVVCAAGIAFAMRQRIVRTCATGIAATYLHLTVVGTAGLVGADATVLHLSLVVCVVSVALEAQFIGSVGARQAAEVVAGGFALVAVLVGTTQPLEWQSAMLTTMGVACGVIALARSDRRGLAVVGALLTGFAYVLRLVASDVGVVEAYTLPFGVILLAVGYVAMRQSQQIRTTAALLPGLAVALAPSLPAVLADPVTVRGLLLGLASLGVLGIGASMRWQAPFVVGVALVTVITVRHLGPYADAVPRWSLIAVAGAIMLAVGVTWESRVRDARSLAGHVGAMR